MKVNDKPIILRDKQACLSIKQRAKKKKRSASNALAVIVLDALKEK